MTTTYTKLRNGSWGVRSEGGRVETGGHVEVRTKAGALKVETIDRVIWTDGKVTLASIRQSGHAQTGSSNRRSYDGSCSDCEWNEDAGDMRGCPRHRGNPRT